MNSMSKMGAALVLALAAGCSNTGEGIKKDADNAGDKMASASSQAGAATDAAMQTADVKTALIADPTVDASGINVDTNKDTKTVTLNGTVPTDAEKTHAAEIAGQKAPGYAVINNLTIKPH